MRVLHLCLSNWFVDGVGYQENELVRQHLTDGHEVLVVASTETHSDDGKLTYIDPSEYMGDEGAKIIRIPYRRFLPELLMRKLRIHVGLRKILETYAPNVILFHGTCGWELITVANYLEHNPNVNFFVDSHEDQYNSARNWLSRELLHKLYYAPILRFALSKIKKILCYTPDSINFVKTIYGISPEKLELFPLGGRPVTDDEYENRRSITRNKYGIGIDEILLIQSGKQTRRKKIIDSVKALSQIQNRNFRFFIIGTIEKSITEEIFQIIDDDERISYLGWKNLDELTDLLCAADIYLQPGSGIQSVTMQHSLCCRCAVILDDLLSHRYCVSNNGWLIGRDGTLDKIIRDIWRVDLEEMKNASFQFAQEHLDYAFLAKRIFNEKVEKS